MEDDKIDLHGEGELASGGGWWPECLQQDQDHYTFSGDEIMPLWTWQLDHGASDLLQSYPSVTDLFPLPDLFQDDGCDMFDEEIGRFCEGLKVDQEDQGVDNDAKDHHQVDEIMIKKEEFMNRSTTDGNYGDIIKKDQHDRDHQMSSRVNNVTFEEVSRCFYMPITQAAKELNIGLTLLKKKCRELGIPRWPHRKMKSLQTLIDNVQELGKQEGEAQLRSAIEILEEERKMMEKEPAMQLEKKTRRLRQACFKANYKRKRLMAAALLSGLPPLPLSWPPPPKS